MKYSKSAIGLLTREYRSVLKKCLLINLGLFALGITSANADIVSDYLWEATTSYQGHALTEGGYLSTAATTTHGAATIWNEPDGGGIMYDTVPGSQMTGNEVFVGVHGDIDGDGVGEFVNLYAKDGNAANTKRIILNTTGAYYLKSNGITTTANDEIATVGAVGSAITTALTDYVSGDVISYTESPATGNHFYTAKTINDNFVAKVEGKGLSSNDFTTALKTTYDGYATTIAGKASLSDVATAGYTKKLQ